MQNDEVYSDTYLKPGLTYQQRRKEAKLRQEPRQRKEEGAQIKGIITEVKSPTDHASTVAKQTGTCHLHRAPLKHYAHL